MLRILTLLATALVCSLLTAQNRQIRVPLDPQLTPDGQSVVFAWQNDVWIADIVDGPATARRLTSHPAADRRPLIAPDGRRVLFMSNRTGVDQVWLLDIDGIAEPRQLTFDTDRKNPVEWSADGTSFLAVRRSDRAPFTTEARRLVVIPIERNSAERVLFDAGASDGAVSPGGHRVLFTRGRVAPTRKGYRGSSASQIWMATLDDTGAPSLSRLTTDREGFQNVSERDPIWAPDGQGFYFVSDPGGTFDVYYRTLGADVEPLRITDVGADGSDDGVLFPSLSADGRRLLFLRRFDLQLLDLESGSTRTLELRSSGDSIASPIERRTIDRSAEVAFTDDGKQIAFVAGHDLFVMDRILREPVRVTTTIQIEKDPVFADSGKRLLFTSEVGGEVDIWEAVSNQEDGHWWRASAFELRKVTDDPAVESNLKPCPTGESVAYVRDGDLYVMAVDGTEHRKIFESWDTPSFDWSPDGKWLCYSVQDDEFNADVWLVPIDGSREPFNVSRHPDSDSRPAWSQDGERIAWIARRDADEIDVYWVPLRKEQEEETERDRKLKKAIEAMGDGDKGKKKKKKPEKEKGETPEEDEKAEEDEDAEEQPKEEDEKEEGPKPIEIDFDGLHERIRRISIRDSRESGLTWSPDGKKLAFIATVDGTRALYKVEFPDELKPEKLASDGLFGARWLKEGDQMVGIDAGKPAALKGKGGKVETFAFTVREARDWRDVRRLAFDQGWRAMRDSFYDGNLNRRDWIAVRAKYRDVATELLGRQEFSLLMNMMLGELNASHMGHSPDKDPLPSIDRGRTWTPRTYHLGLRFDPAAGGPGLLVESVIPKSPCAQERSMVTAGERVTSIDGTAIDPDTDLYRLTTLPELRDMVLTVRSAAGEDREVTVRPVTSVSRLVYDEWVEFTRRQVEQTSDGRLGYLHIRGMDSRSFRQLEEDLYAAGAGKDGLVIDVRFNGGGSTADHVLTVLNQPRHAITVPRGGGPGYPQDRKIYASWWKPIVLMCNEMSFSNAEILSHAVKTLDRGQVVGMRTAGGVISTSARMLADGSMVRMPFRGWFVVADGQDMERNGCLPDHALWNRPDGPDDQLAKAVEVLLTDCDARSADPEPVPASRR